MTASTNWKHQTAKAGEINKIEHIAVFDDENQDCDAIYKKAGDKLIACRTICRHNRQHWERTLLAWAIKAPLLDCRNDQTVPLP